MSEPIRKLLQLTPATSEEVEKFISDNRRWIDDTVAAELRNMNPLDQRRIVSGGTIVSCRDASGVIRSRVRQAKEKEALLAGMHSSQAVEGTAAVAGDRIAVITQGGGGALSKPATPEEVEAFIGSNKRWLSEEAEEILKVMNPTDQKRVIAAGTMSGCRDPVAVVQTRAKKAREMEVEFEQLTRGKQEKVNEPVVPVPKFSAEVGAAYIYAKPEEVRREESRFAPPPAKGTEDNGGLLVGDVRGVGGVVEILRAKYGCSRGQRMRVIGETNGLLQFEGGKTVPKNHEGSGYRWVLQSGEEAAKPQPQEAEVVRGPASEPALKAREEKAKAAPEVKAKDRGKDKERAKKRKAKSSSPSRSSGRQERKKKKR